MGLDLGLLTELRKSLNNSLNLVEQVIKELESESGVALNNLDNNWMNRIKTDEMADVKHKLKLNSFDSLEHDRIRKTASLQAAAIESILKRQSKLENDNKLSMRSGIISGMEYGIDSNEVMYGIQSGMKVAYIMFNGYKYRINTIDGILDIMINAVRRKYANGESLLEHQFSLERGVKDNHGGADKRLVISVNSGMITNCKRVPGSRLYRNKDADVIRGVMDLVGLLGESVEDVKVAFIN